MNNLLNHPLVQKIEAKLENIFTKQAPALPEDWKKFLVRIIPYLAILAIILAVPTIAAALGLGSLATALAPIAGAQATMAMPIYWISIASLIITTIVTGLAIPGLLKKETIGWKYLFISQLIAAVLSLLSLNFIGGAVNAIIGFYLLFQIKSHYK